MNKSKKLNNKDKDDQINYNLSDERVEVLNHSYNVLQAPANTIRQDKLLEKDNRKYVPIYNSKGKIESYIISLDKEDVDTILRRAKDPCKVRHDSNILDLIHFYWEAKKLSRKPPK